MGTGACKKWGDKHTQPERPINYTKEGNDEYYTFCSLIIAHKYNLKKLWESKVMHVSGSFMTLCHLHVTINVKASTQGRGREEREGLWWWEGQVHVHWRQVCFAEISLGLITVLTLGSWSTPYLALVSKGGQHYPVGTCKIISFHWFLVILIHWIVIYPLDSTT